MKIKEIQILASLMKSRMGWAWPIVLLKAWLGKNTILEQTRWSTSRGPESEFVRRLSLSPSLYLDLIKRIGIVKAFEIMHELLVSIGCNEQWEHLHSMGAEEGTGMGRLEAFNRRMDQKGTPRFNQREYIQQDDKTCHFRITRCVFFDFYTETAVPELTKAFCEVDRIFFPEAFPDFRFHRGDSWENTIAYGKPHCEFIFEMKAD